MNKNTFNYAPRTYGHMTLRPTVKILSDEDYQISERPSEMTEDHEMLCCEEGTHDTNTQLSQDSQVTSLMLPERTECTYEESECSICFEVIQPGDGEQLDCDGRHRFHFGCYLQWKNECPLCRQEAKMINVDDQMVFNYAEKLLSEDEQIFRQMSSLFQNYSEKGGVTREKWLQRISDSTLSTMENVEALYDHVPPTQITYIL